MKKVNTPITTFLLVFIASLSLMLTGCNKDTSQSSALDTKKDDSTVLSSDKTYHVSYDLNGAFMLDENATLDKDVSKGSVIEFNKELYDSLSDLNTIFPPVNQEVDYFEIDGEKYGLGSSYTVNSDVTIKLIFKPSVGCYWVTYDLNGGSYINPAFDHKSSLSIVYLYDVAPTIIPPEGKTLDGAIINGERHYTGEAVTIKEDSELKYLWKDKMTLSDFEYEESDGEITITGIKNDEVLGIDIPNGVTKINDWAFYGCKNVKSIIVPETVKSIGEMAFGDCPNLLYVSLSRKMNTISSGLFNNCTSLEKVYIPVNVKVIDDYAFSNCTSIKEIRFPDGIEYIGDFAFDGCTSLKFNEYEDGKYLGSLDNPYLVFMGPNSKDIKDFSIHESTRYIHSKAFEECSNLENIVFPLNLTSIGSFAFSKCTVLSNITIPNTVTFLGSYVFKKCILLTDFIIPDSITRIGNGLFNDCTGLTNITIPNTVTEIGTSAFFGCTSLNTIALPESITSIEDMAFSNCTSLTSITIPSKVEQIGMYTFSGCSSLKEVTISEGLTEIIFSAFEDCIELESITLPSTLTSIGHDAFKGCIKLSTVNYNGSEEEWNNVTKGDKWVDDLSKVNIIYSK